MSLQEPSVRRFNLARAPESVPLRVNDHHDARAEATIFAMAAERRELEQLKRERDHLHDLNAAAKATIHQYERDLAARDAEIDRLKALTDRWQGEAMRLQGIMEGAVAGLMGGLEHAEGAQ